MSQPTNNTEDSELHNNILDIIDTERSRYKVAIAVAEYIEQRELKARLDELKPVSFRVKDALSVSSGPRSIVRTHLVDEFIDKRTSELNAQLNQKEGRQQ